MKHLILHPVEAPAAELETVIPVPVPEKDLLSFTVTLPLQLTRCCSTGSLRVLAVTPADVPCRVSAKIFAGTRLKIRIRLFGDSGRRPPFVSVHLAGRARTSPPAWEHHSRQQFTSNRRAFERALP